MREDTQILVAALILAALTLLAIAGTLFSDPVMAIFALVFLLMAVLVWREWWTEKR